MSSSKMGSNNNTLVKLKNAGYQQNNKWLDKGVWLEVEKGKIVRLIKKLRVKLKNILTKLDMFLKKFR